MASKQTSQNFKFQYYIDMAKQKKIHWNVFVNLMEDLSYSNIDRLKYLNAILLVELTNSGEKLGCHWLANFIFLIIIFNSLWCPVL